MIEFKKGDILDEEAEALVNTVNCVGVMGRGIALQFKRAFPENFKDYAVRCKRNEVQPGRMLVFETREMFTPRYIINFPTKRHWRGKSRIEDIESGLRSLAEEVRSRRNPIHRHPAAGKWTGRAELVRRCEITWRRLSAISRTSRSSCSSPGVDPQTKVRIARATCPQ